MTGENGQAGNVGTIVEIRGVVIDAVFQGELPAIYNALKIDCRPPTARLGDNPGGRGAAARRRRPGARDCDGCDRRSLARARRDRHRWPDHGSGRRGHTGPDLQRAGRAGGQGRAASRWERWQIHRDPPELRETSRRRSRSSRPASRSIDLLAPVRQGRQGRPVRRRRRGQDRADPGADQQHRLRARRSVGVRRRGRAHARGQRPLPRDDRVRRDRQDRAGVRPDERAARRPPAGGPVGLTMAEYFRDEQGQDVLLFIDNIFRFVQAGSEVSALLGRMPSAVGYQPTLATEMGQLQERITSTNKGSITSVQAIYVPADDLTDPAPAASFAHLDATTVLSRVDLREGHLSRGGPARFQLSRILQPRVVWRRALRRRHAGAAGAAALQGPAGHHRHPRYGRAVRRGQAGRLPRPQDPALPVAAVLRGRAVHRHARASTSSSRTRSRSFAEILEGKHDDLPEQAFYMVGTIEEAQAAGERMKTAAA